jgi:hypothetical protein
LLGECTVDAYYIEGRGSEDGECMKRLVGSRCSRQRQTANLLVLLINKYKLRKKQSSSGKDSNRTACQTVPYPKNWTSKPTVTFTGTVNNLKNVPNSVKE